MQLTHDAMLLGLESQRVMGLRLMKLSRGGRPAQAEALRMFSEKATALAEAGTTLARGGSAGRSSGATEHMLGLTSGVCRSRNQVLV